MLLYTIRRICIINLIFVGLFCISLLYFFLGAPKLGNKKSSRLARKIEGPLFQLEQNGDYWICNNFISAKTTNLYGNESLTLTTHGTYVDFGHLEWLLVRWNAPISMAILVDGKDFKQTLQSFYHIKYCTAISSSFFNWVSVHLVFHGYHLSEFLEPMLNVKPFGFRCHAPYSQGLQNETYWFNNDLIYPISLLKNVARLNANTFYVFSLDLDMLPTLNFVHNFLDFIKLQKPSQPLKSIYCVPIFPQLTENSQLPKYKSDLFSQMHALNISLLPNSTVRKKLDYMEPWLQKHLQDGDLDVFEITNDPQKCAAYVSVNNYEPLYDQRLAEMSHNSESLHMLMLNQLNFDFIVLDGTFLIQRREPNWRNIILNRKPPSDYQKSQYLREMIKVNDLVLSIK